METRRIRRLERRRSRRLVVITAALGAIGVAIGLALPRNTTASVLVLLAAIAALATIAARAESIAPSHGLHHVVRLPLLTALSATTASLWSRIVGTTRTVWQRTPRALPAAAEHDDEAEAWWGSRPEPGPEPQQKPVTVTLDLDGGERTSSRAERLRTGLRRNLAGIRQSFTRRMGDEHVASDRASSDALEGSTFSTGRS